LCFNNQASRDRLDRSASQEVQVQSVALVYRARKEQLATLGPPVSQDSLVQPDLQAHRVNLGDRARLVSVVIPASLDHLEGPEILVSRVLVVTLDPRVRLDPQASQEQQATSDNLVRLAFPEVRE